MSTEHSTDFDQSLQKAIHKSVCEHLSSERLQQVIHDRLEKTVAEAVDSALRSYSDVGKTIQEAISQSLAIDGQQFTLPSLSNVVASIVSKRVETILNDAGRNRLISEIDEIFGTCPKQIKLSELVEKFKEMESDSESCGCDENQITLIVSHDDVFGSPYCHIYIDRESGTDKFRCDVQIDVKGVTPTDNNPDELPQGEVYAIKVNGMEIDRENRHSPFVGPLYSFDRLCFNLYANRSALVIDEDACDTWFNARD